MRLAKSFMNTVAAAPSRVPIIQDETSLVSASRPTHVQTSPWPNWPLYSAGTFLALA